MEAPESSGSCLVIFPLSLERESEKISYCISVTEKGPVCSKGRRKCTTVAGAFEALPVLYDAKLMAAVCGKELIPHICIYLLKSHQCSLKYIIILQIITRILQFADSPKEIKAM